MLRFLGVPTSLSSRGGSGGSGPAIEIQGCVEYFLPVCFFLSSFFNNINTKLVFLQYSVDSKPVHQKYSVSREQQGEYNKCMQGYCHEFFFGQLLLQLASTPSPSEEKMFFTTKQPCVRFGLVWFGCRDVIESKSLLLPLCLPLTRTCTLVYPLK